MVWAYGIGFSGRRAQPPKFEISNVPNPPELFSISEQTPEQCGGSEFPAHGLRLRASWIMGTLPDDLHHS